MDHFSIASLGPEAGAIIFATIVGPLAAVIVTLWHQNRATRKRIRHDLFSQMMRWRRHPTNTEFVGALNLVPVHFHKDKEVLQRYSQLMETFESPSWRSSDQEAVRRINEQVDTRIAYLLSTMGNAVGVTIDQIHILRGAYAPQGWADEENRNKQIRELIAEFVSSKRPLPIVVLSTPPLPSTADTASEPTKEPPIDDPRNSTLNTRPE
ncbi:DUF6680 family protein [Oceanibaculum nanhaiense]|uniref:DUF6680 family protein n=1 Tax=Oceanibaculum nanhaiense TaxID=1909734 RepID=UPI003D2D334F